MHPLIEWGNTASSLNVLQTIFTYPENILPGMAAVVIALIFIGSRQLFSRQFLIVGGIALLAAWAVGMIRGDDMLKPTAALLAGLAVWTGIELYQSYHSRIAADNHFVKPAWHTFLTAMVTSSLALSISLIEVAWFRGEPLVRPGWIGIVELLMFAVRETLWVITTIALVAAAVFYVRQFIERRTGGEETVAWTTWNI